jgi:hypothetical protein
LEVESAWLNEAAKEWMRWSGNERGRDSNGKKRRRSEEERRLMRQVGEAIPSR